MRWQQQWADVLFLHYAVAPAELSPRLPPGLTIDTYGGQAWLSLVFFRLHVRPLGWPAVPGFSSLLELNVRTYVTWRDIPGIVFFPMFADNHLAIAAARLLSPLRYARAEMQTSAVDQPARRMICRPCAGGELSARFQVAGHEQSIPHGSLDFWLLERYCLFVRTAAGRLVVGEVEHPPWKLRPVQLIDVHNSLSGMQRLSINSPPDACHYSSGVAAKFGRFHDLSARAAHFKHASAMASLPQVRASARCAVR